MALILQDNTRTYDYDLCIKGISDPGDGDLKICHFLEFVLQESNIKSKVVYSEHEVSYRDLEYEFQIQLLFDGERCISDRNRKVVYEFCLAIFDPESEHLVKALSKHGLLGFSAGETEFGKCWNLLAVSFSLMRGEAMGNDIFNPEIKPPRDRWPMWANIACMIGVTAYEHCFLFEPGIWGSDFNAIAETLARLATKQVQQVEEQIDSGVSSTPLLVQSLKLWAACQTEQTKIEKTQVLRDSFQQYFQLSNCLLKKIKLSTDQECIPVSEQFEIYQDLYHLYEVIGSVYSSTAEMMEVYIQSSVQQGVSSGVHLGLGILSGRGSWAAFKVANMTKDPTTKVLENVPMQSLLNTPRWCYGLLKGTTSKEIATGQVTSLQAASSAFKLVGYAGAAMTTYHVGRSVMDGFNAVQDFKRAEICRKMSKHTANIVTVTTQTRISLAWVHTVNGKVEFIGDAKNAWEQYLRDKYGKEVDPALFKPEFVKAELNQCVLDLEQLGGELEKESSQVLGATT